MATKWDEFGRLLGKHREESKLTQDQLRQRLNVHGYDIKSKGSISKWESGKNRPKAGVVEALEDIFSLRRGVLLRPAGYLVETPEMVSVDNVSQEVQVNLEKKEEHYKHLSLMANAVLRGEHNLIDAWENRSGKGQQYVIQDRGGMGVGATREELAEALNLDIWETCAKYSERDFYELLVPHLEADNESIKIKGFGRACTENPYEVINTLLRLARTMRFNAGKCPVCQDW